jgi:hypothetical protein
MTGTLSTAIIIGNHNLHLRSKNQLGARSSLASMTIPAQETKAHRPPSARLDWADVATQHFLVAHPLLLQLCVDQHPPHTSIVLVDDHSRIARSAAGLLRRLDTELPQAHSPTRARLDWADVATQHFLARSPAPRRRRPQPDYPIRRLLRRLDTELPQAHSPTRARLDWADVATQHVLACAPCSSASTSTRPIPASCSSTTSRIARSAAGLLRRLNTEGLFAHESQTRLGRRCNPAFPGPITSTAPVDDHSRITRSAACLGGSIQNYLKPIRPREPDSIGRTLQPSISSSPIPPLASSAVEPTTLASPAPPSSTSTLRRRTHHPHITSATLVDQHPPPSNPPPSHHQRQPRRPAPSAVEPTTLTSPAPPPLCQGSCRLC